MHIQIPCLKSHPRWKCLKMQYDITYKWAAFTVVPLYQSTLQCASHLLTHILTPPFEAMVWPTGPTGLSEWGSVWTCGQKVHMSTWSFSPTINKCRTSNGSTNWTHILDIWGQSTAKHKPEVKAILEPKHPLHRWEVMQWQDWRFVLRLRLFTYPGVLEKCTEPRLPLIVRSALCMAACCR